MGACFRTQLGIFAMVVLCGCSYAAPPVRLSGVPRDFDRLAGEWVGEYIGDRDHRRQGSISFKLVAGEDHAHGDVLMTAAGFDHPYEPYRGDDFYPRPHELAPPSR